MSAIYRSEAAEAAVRARYAEVLELWPVAIQRRREMCIRDSAAPAPRPEAADEWIADQIRYFDSRIASRRGAIRFVEGSGWVLFSLGLGAALCLVAMQAPFIPPGLWMAAARLSLLGRIVLLIAGCSLIGWLCLDTTRTPLVEHGDDEPGQIQATRPDWINGLIAGVVLTDVLCDVATLMPPAAEQALSLIHI